MNAEKTALVVVDVQKAFADASWGERNNPEAEANITLILTEELLAQISVAADGQERPVHG